MQYADGLDAVEAAADRGQLQDVGLRDLDVAQPRFANLSPGIGEAWHADIDREDARRGKSLRDLEDVASGPAAGDQNLIGNARLAAIGSALGVRLRAGVPVNRPARLGIFLILPHDLKRHAVLDRGQHRNGAAIAQLFQRLAHLLAKQAAHGFRPVPAQ